MMPPDMKKSGVSIRFCRKALSYDAAFRYGKAMSVRFHVKHGVFEFQKTASFLTV